MITRIRALLEARQLSPTQFADLIGVGRPVISHILSERNKPSLEVVQKIIGAFPDISMPWLLAGTGPMLVTAAGAPLPAPAAVVPPTAPPPTARQAAFERPAPIATQPSTYPLPSKFRPGTIAAPAPAPAPAGSGSVVSSSPAIATPAPIANAAPVAASPSQEPYSSPAATPSMSSPSLPAESLGASFPPVSPTAEAPVLPATATSELDAPPPHPAAALSFLGEPGKAIRRIVIFYRDGSFSDYLPEGN